MSPPRSSPQELQRRLFRELSRGHAAELAPILAQLDLLVEPPAHVDAAILAAVPDVARKAEPPLHVDRAVLAASEAAVAAPTRGTVIPFRRRRVVAYVGGGALAVAAGLAVVAGLRSRGSRDVVAEADVVVTPVDPEPAHAARNDLSPPDDELQRAAERLAVDVGAKLGDEQAARVRGSLLAGTGDDTHPTAASAGAWSPAEEDRFAGELLAFTDRVAADDGANLSAQLDPMLVRARERCRERGRCYGLISLRLATLALADGRGTDAARYAADAARTDDEEIRLRARAAAEKAAASSAGQDEAADK